MCSFLQVLLICHLPVICHSWQKQDSETSLYTMRSLSSSHSMFQWEIKHSLKRGLLALFCAWEKWGSEKGSKDHTAGISWWLRGVESACQCCRHRFDPDLGRCHKPRSTHAPQLLKPVSPRAQATKEATAMRTYTPHWRAVPARLS